MRESIRQFVRLCAEYLPISEPIYEFGALQVINGGDVNLRPFFSGKTYVGADMRKGPGVDIVLNLHKIDLPSESVGTVLVMDTFEHVEFPRNAISEIYRILKPNGTLIMSSVMKYPIHDYPFDYWRFTPEAFKSLLGPFASKFVGSAGESAFPETVVGIGFKGTIWNSIDFKHQFDCWAAYWSDIARTIPRSKTGKLKLLLPPALHLMFRFSRAQNHHNHYIQASEKQVK